MLNTVTSSLFNGRNIKYHLAFAIRNALPSCCAAYMNRRHKREMNKAEKKRGRLREVVVSYSSILLSKKSLVPALAFIYHHVPMIYIYIRCVRRADFLFLFLLSITVLTSLAIYAAINHHAWGNPIPS
jgi:hypothetical protein